MENSLFVSFIMMSIAFVNSNRLPSIGFCQVETGDGRTKLESYNPNYQLCCSKMVVQLVKNQDCCGGKYFIDTTKSICCNGQVFPKWISTPENTNEVYENVCCGKEPMLTKKNLKCGGGKQRQLTDDQEAIRDYLQWCVTKFIDRRDRICCDGVDHEIMRIGCCNNKPYFKRQSKCVKKQIRGKEEHFCGRDFYNPLKDMCCDRQVIRGVPDLIKVGNHTIKNPNASCCGGEVITSKEKCCEERWYRYPTHSIPNKDDLDCCGLGYYNLTSQLCLDGKGVDVLPNEDRCGNTPYDTSYQDCCAKQTIFNTTTHECCKDLYGESHCVIKKGEKCCNGHKVRDSEICCEDIKPCQKRRKEDNDCCFDYMKWDGETFNNSQAQCYQGQIMHIPPGYSPCGLNDFIDPKDPEGHFCCEDRKYSKDQGQCCEGIFSSIPKSEGSCCIVDRRVYKFDDASNPCRIRCNKREFFDTSSEICCQGHKFKMTGQNYCCGPYAVNSDVQCCGGNFPYRDPKRKDCCHDTQLYHPRRSVCTDTGKVQPKGSMKGLSHAQKLCKQSSVKNYDGLFQEACVRQYAIQGRIVKLTQKFSGGTMELIVKLKAVKSLSRDEYMPFPQWEPSRRMTFILDMNNKSMVCPLDHLQKLKRVIILFDFLGYPSKRVKIPATTPFILSRRSLLRRYTVTKAVTQASCKPFLL